MLIINCWFHLLYSDVFTTIHKHSLFMTPSCSTVFHFLTYVSLLQYSRSLKVLAFRKTLAHISANIHVLAIHGLMGEKQIAKN